MSITKEALELLLIHCTSSILDLEDWIRNYSEQSPFSVHLAVITEMRRLRELASDATSLLENL